MFYHTTNNQPSTTCFYFVFSDCDRGEKMIGKIFSHLLGSAAEDFEAGDESYGDLMEFEEGGWVIVNVSGDKIHTII